MDRAPSMSRVGDCILGAADCEGQHLAVGDILGKGRMDFVEIRDFVESSQGKFLVCGRPSPSPHQAMACVFHQLLSFAEANKYCKVHPRTLERHRLQKNPLAESNAVDERVATAHDFGLFATKRRTMDFGHPVEGFSDANGARIFSGDVLVSTSYPVTFQHVRARYERSSGPQLIGGLRSTDIDDALCISHVQTSTVEEVRASLCLQQIEFYPLVLRLRDEIVENIRRAQRHALYMNSPECSQ